MYIYCAHFHEPLRRIMLSDIPDQVRKAMREDFKSGDFPKLSNINVAQCCFKNVSGTNIWVFEYATHEACSSLSSDCFHCATPDLMVIIDHGTCKKQDGSHMKLLPYFYDNPTVQKICLEKSPTEQDGIVSRPLLDRLSGLLKRPFEPPKTKLSSNNPMIVL